MEIDWKKKYNEALEKIKRYTIDDYGCTRLKPTDIFPELSESEDEKIKKELIEFIQWAEDRGVTRHDFHQAKRPLEWIAWLEKQKTINEKESFIWTKHDEAVRKEAIACLEDWEGAIIRVGGLVDYENILAWLKEELPEKQKEQKLEWSKEDIERYLSCLQRLGTDNPDQPETINSKWFKEHCYPQSNKKWNEEDKNRLEEAIGMIEANGTWVRSDDGVKQVSDFLKALPERFNLQQKQEWSEEDERMLSRCIKSVECSKQFADSKTYKAAKDVEMTWLKSLKNRGNSQKSNDNSPWKPSKEQMDSLRDTIVQTKGYSYSMYLSELYEQLKKLM